MKLKKKCAALAAASLICVSGVMCAGLTGCSGETDADDRTVFPVSTYNDTGSVTMGDVMPFYDDGTMYVFHLQNTSSSSSSVYYHPISCLTTTDYVHYNDEGVVINYEEDYASPDAAIGTGSFIKDENGVYHCFYTGHNSEEDTGLPYAEVIRHATSTDLINWTKDEDFNLYGSSDDFRDAYVYYDDYDERYYMLVTTNSGGTGVIERYMAASLDADSSEWTDVGVFFENDDGTYNMECPSYIEYNGYYYLAFSEQGDDRVTHYRYKTERNGDWQSFERDSIDASGFYAGRLEKAGGDLYAFAWCATLTGGSTGDFDWGGNLVVHQIKQLSNGELCATMVESVGQSISEQTNYTFSDGSKVENLSFNGESFGAKSVSALSDGVIRISFTLTLNNYDGDCGLTFGLKDTLDNRLGAAVIAFEPSTSRLVCYNDVSNILRYGSALAEVSFAYAKGKTYTVDVLIDGEILTVYLDDTVAMTARIPDMDGNCFAFYSNGISVEFGGITFYE